GGKYTRADRPRAGAAILTPVELDTFRAQLIATNKRLALIVCGRPSEYVFDGRRASAELEKSQLVHNERRMRFLKSMSSEEVRRLASDLPRAQGVLQRAATGWRDTQGIVHRFGIYAPPIVCPHGID